jgi:hypothetical protein
MGFQDYILVIFKHFFTLALLKYHYLENTVDQKNGLNYVRGKLEFLN